MFRFFLRLNIIGWIVSQALFVLYVLILVAPVFVGLGLIGQSEGTSNVIQSNLLEILSAKGLQAFLKAGLYSFSFSLVCSISGTICGFYTSRYFTGKSILLLPVAFLLIVPDFLSFLINTPLVGIFSGAKNLSALTYGGSLTWGFVLCLFCSHAFFMRVSTAEIRSTTMLGAGFLENLLYYLLPRSQNLIIYTTLFLTLQFICQGLFTARYAIKPSDTFFFYLKIPPEVYDIHGPGTIAYGFLLCSGILGALVAFRYFQLEFSDSGIASKPRKIVTQSKKKVTRKKKKKRKQKKNPTSNTSEKASPQTVEESPINSESSVEPEEAVADDNNSEREGGE